MSTFINSNVNSALSWVKFLDIPANYIPGRDIFVIYEISDGFRVCSNDWVGLYRCDTITDIHQFIAFEWTSKRPGNVRFPQIRSCLFLARELDETVRCATNSEEFQFLYIHKGCRIVGISRRFSISNDPRPSVQCVDRTDDSFGKITFIDVVKSSGRRGGRKSKAKMIEKNETSEEYEFVVNDADDAQLIVDDESESGAESQKWDVVPYCANMGEQWLTPVSTPKLQPGVTISLPTDVYQQMMQVVSSIQRPLSAPYLMKCSLCKKRHKQMIRLNQEQKVLKLELNRMKTDVSDKSDQLEMKEWLLAVLSDQVKNVMDENATMRSMKAKLEESPKCNRNCTKIGSKAAILRAENSRLRQQLSDAVADMEDIQEIKDEMELTAREAEVKVIENCGGIEQYLNGLMFKLSGNEAPGSIMDVDHRTLDEMFQHINDQLHLLAEEIGAEIKRKEEIKQEMMERKEAYQRLVNSQIDLSRDNDELSDRVQHLEHLLNAEQKRRTEQSKNFKEIEEELNQRISSLSAQLEDLYLKRNCDEPEEAQEEPENSQDSSSKNYGAESDGGFSFSKFLSDSLQVMSDQFGGNDAEDEANQSLLTDVSSYLHAHAFDFYPSNFPEPNSSSWMPTPLNDGPINPPAVIDDVSFGSACSNRKVLFDFRDDDSTKDVVDAGGVEVNETGPSFVEVDAANIAADTEPCPPDSNGSPAQYPAEISEPDNFEPRRKVRRRRRRSKQGNKDKAMKRY